MMIYKSWNNSKNKQNPHLGNAGEGTKIKKIQY